MYGCARVYHFSFFLFFLLSLATTITVLTPVSCYCITLFRYDGKKKREASVTCRCHLNNSMADSIFYDSYIVEDNLPSCLFACLFAFLFVFSSIGGKQCFSKKRRNGYSCLLL